MPAPSPKSRFRLLRSLPFAMPPLLAWAVVVGVVGALSTIAFREALAAAQWLLLGRSGSLVELAGSLPWWQRILVPTAGGAIAGLLLMAARRSTFPGASDYMAAIAHEDGRISIPKTLLNSVSSLSTIASGGSIGREGSMVQLAAMCASIAGRFGKFDSAQLRVLVACGAAAGIASAYNAPIASAFFVSEIVLGAIVMDSFGPIVVAAVVANITMREFPGYHPAFEMPAIPPIGMIELIPCVAIGLAAGLLAPLFLRLLDAVKCRIKEAGLPVPLKLAGGGLVVGLISIWTPQVWGNGYSVVNSLLHTPWLWTAVLLVLAAKVVATAATVGSGAIGGVFTPTLFVGAALGYLFGIGAHDYLPFAASPPSTYAVVGMGAFLAAATGAPLMAILMIFEMTLSYQVMLPLMLASVLAYYASRSSEGTAMYDITVTRIREEKARTQLRATLMRELIQPAETILPIDAPFSDMTRMFLQFPVKYIYIIDAANRYQGVVALQDLTMALLKRDDGEGKTARDFLRRDFLKVVTPEMSLNEALNCFLAHQGERLPAIRSQDDPQLLGVVYKTALLDAYYRLNG
jgi:CIC family chloride channel protein